MSLILIAVIAITVIISLVGFQDPMFFEKYKFNVGAIQNRKEYIRLLSAGFLHADYGHLFFNMFSLYLFSGTVISGTITEDGELVEGFGILGFLIIYFASMILGNLFSLYLYKSQSWYSAIGASGGVSGIVFAAIALYPFNGVGIFPIPFYIDGYIFGALYFSYSVYMMLNPNQNDNVGHAAHLGGAFFGLVYAVANQPEVAMGNALQLGIMAIPLIYMGYQVFVRKRIG